MIKYLIIICLIYPITTLGQKLNHKTEFDLDKDNKKELLLFYDELNGEFDKTEFTRFCIVIRSDTICVENVDPWIEQASLYLDADEDIDKRVGLIKENGRLFIWLTGFQYGCCLNNTSIFEWTGKSLNKIFSQDFEVSKIEIINGVKYLIGDYSSSQSERYGDREDFYFESLFPTEYHKLLDSMKVDENLTQMKNRNIQTFEDNINVYRATVVHINYTGEQIMISKKMETSLDERDYGLMSITKLKKEYFSKFDNQRLRLIRNELYAYHGYSFNSQDLSDFFKEKKWYKPTQKTIETISSELSEIERYNIGMIQEIETKRQKSTNNNN